MTDTQKLQELLKLSRNLAKEAADLMHSTQGNKKRPLGRALTDFNNGLKKLHLDEDSEA